MGVCVMQISPINNSQQNTGFKSAMPVIVKIGQDFDTAAPVVGKEINEMFMRRAERMLNNSLKRGINPQRDLNIDKLREYFGKRVKDFCGRVTAFTCVDGQLKDGELNPYFYFLTGDTADKLEILRTGHKAAVVESQGYDTANLRISKDNYYNIGKQLVQKAFRQFNPTGRGPEAFFICFEPVRNKHGVIKDYALRMIGFRPIENLKNPYIKLDKLA